MTPTWQTSDGSVRLYMADLPSGGELPPIPDMGMAASPGEGDPLPVRRKRKAVAGE